MANTYAQNEYNDLWDIVGEDISGHEANCKAVVKDTYAKILKDRPEIKRLIKERGDALILEFSFWGGFNRPEFSMSVYDVEMDEYVGNISAYPPVGYLMTTGEFDATITRKNNRNVINIKA